MSKFAHLKPKTPIGQVVVDYTLWDLPSEPVLKVRTTADPNHDYRDAVVSQVGRSRRKFRGNRRDDPKAMEKLQHDLDMELFPKHVVVGWSGLFDGDGNPCEFNEADCREFLGILHEAGQFTPLRSFCADVTNFSDVFADPEEAAGNSQPVSNGN